MPKKNRLANLIQDFAKEFELNHKVDNDKCGALLGVPESGKLIHTKYTFDESQDGYVFGAALAHVEPSEASDIARKILTSEPIRGLTERIIQDRLVVLGSRDNLNNLSDADVQRGFMDDAARVSEYHKRLKGFLNTDKE